MVGINSQVAKNRAYNAERKRMNDAVMKEIDRDKFIMQIHQKSISRIQTQIDQFYLNYAKSTGVSFQDAKKMASQMDVLKFQEKAKKAVEELDFTESTNEWLKIYNLKMKVSRLELMKAQISLELHSMYDYDYKYMYSELEDEAMAEFKTQAGIMGNSAEATKEQIDKIIMMDFHGKNFSERIWGRNGYYERAQSEIFDSMSAIYTDMAGYKKERRRLMDKFETSEYEVMRLLKTEVSRVNSQARQEVYNQQGFTHYHYVAEPGACPICRELNGKTFKVEEREIGVNAAPMHPSCRCRDYGEIELFLNGESTITGERKKTPGDKADDSDYTKSRDTLNGYIKDFKTYINGSEGDFNQRKFGRFVLDKTGLEDVKISVRKLDGAYGQVEFAGYDDIAEVAEYALNSQDLRKDEYKQKTAFHELFHAKSNGLKTDMMTNRHKWIEMEEFFAETGANYMAGKIGTSELSPSYPEKLIKWAPRLQKLDKYKNCKTLADFGEIGWLDRLSGKGSQWEEFFDEVNAIDFDDRAFARKYIKDIESRKDFYIDKMLENSPKDVIYRDYMKENLDNAIAIVKETNDELRGNDSYVFDRVLATALNILGVEK